LKDSKLFPERSDIVDICNKNKLKELLTGDIVINLAAVHRDDVADLSQYYSTNVEGAKVLCEVCEDKGINKIIFTSSVAVYGFAEGETGEDGKINPFNEYGRTKAVAEDIYRAWQSKDPINRSLIIVRPTVVFGEGNRGNVFNLLNQIYSGNFAMIGNGMNKKSMAYVKNLSSFLEKCIYADKKDAIYNYIDLPNLTMNQLVSKVKYKFKGKKSVGMRIPKFIGLIIGYVADFLNMLGIKLPVSSIRIKKFCASSEFVTCKHELDGFEAPFTLEEGLNNTLVSEFIEPDPKRQIFYTE
jgi:nucleoside-diphosphate-sugar epimerase